MRSPSSASVAGSTVTEPMTAIATTTMVASAIEVKTARPVNSSPASATTTVTPETTIARPTVAAAASSAACASLTGAALLALTADVEEGVVDADGEPDQGHQRAAAAAVGRDLGDDAERAHGGGDRGQAEQQRHRRGDDGAERQQQDHERDRERDDLRALEVLLEDLLEALVHGAPAGLVQRGVGVGAPDRGDGSLDRRDVLGGVVGVAAQRHLDEHAAPARGRELGRVARAADGADLAQAVEARLERGGRGGGRGTVGRAHEDALAGRAFHPGRDDLLVGAGRFSRPVSEPVRDLVPVIAPANTQAATKTSQRAMVVRGRRADAAAARRTQRASAPSGEVGMEFMPAPSQRPAPPSVGRSTVRAPPAPGRDGGLTRRAQR